jgi:hypothetical protein
MVAGVFIALGLQAVLTVGRAQFADLESGKGFVCGPGSAPTQGAVADQGITEFIGDSISDGGYTCTAPEVISSKPLWPDR